MGWAIELDAIEGAAETPAGMENLRRLARALRVSEAGDAFRLARRLYLRMERLRREDAQALARERASWAPVARARIAALRGEAPLRRPRKTP